jgi:hypothetical protein
MSAPAISAFTTVVTCRYGRAPRPYLRHRTPGLVDGQLAEIGGVPADDALGIEAHHRHLNPGTVIGDHRHSGATHISDADAAVGANHALRAFRK